MEPNSTVNPNVPIIQLEHLENIVILISSTHLHTLRSF